MRPLHVLVCLLTTVCFAQEAPKKAAEPKAKLESHLSAMQWRSIGPANMGGRITALAVYENDPTTWWAATASGGLLKTTNNGVTFVHQFDREATVSIGDVAVAQSDPNVVWVGTGEANPRNSVSWGDGVYKSTDGGETWKNMGLRKSFQIGAVVIHPTNPDVVYVGALGRLWGPNEERGLYKTTDGGKTWSRILKVDDKTGVVDVRMHPEEPDTLLVATWERQRDGFDANDPAKRWGPGSGLYRTTDGGESFARITAGLPTSHIGRIGLAYCRTNPHIAYLVLESERIGKEPENAPFIGIVGTDADAGARLTSIVKGGPAEKAGLRKGDIVLSVDGETVHSYADLIRLARRHVAGDTIVVDISRQRKGALVPLTLGKRPEPPEPKKGQRRRRRRSPFAAGLGGQRANFTDQQGEKGHEYGGVYRSADGGATWTRVNSVNPRPMYFSEIRVDPNDDLRVWLLGIRLWKSKDGGKTFTPDGHGRGVHVDHHALWIDPADRRHLILGNDGGVYVSWDGGKHWDHLNHVAIGQFYHVGVGPRRAYRVYGGLQDNGSWGGPSRVRHAPGPTNADWVRIGAGDGFVCRVDPNDPDLVYFTAQNGAIGRRHLKTAERAGMRPRAPKGTRYRFNWNTPFLLSHHNSRIYYTAGNKVFRSLDRGNGLRAISPGITTTDRGSATALAESPRDANVLYVGTDDGGLWRTRDGGHTWDDLWPEPEEAKEPVQPAVKQGEPVGPAPVQPASKSDPEREEAKDSAGKPIAELLPGRRWVGHLEASRFEDGRVYVAFDAHRSNDDRPYAFVSEDHGTTWRPLHGNLPGTAGTTRVIREDLENPNLLYLGTEFGAWVSIDRGATWASLNTNLPTVAVHAFALHPTAGEIVAATHGRSLWVLDVTALRQMTPETLAADAHLYRPNTAVHWRPQPSRGGSRAFIGENPGSGARILFSLKKKTDGLKLRVESLDGATVRELATKGEAGMNRVAWDLRGPRPSGRRGRWRRGRRVAPGTYRVVLEAAGKTLVQPLEVVIDPDYPDERWIAHEEHAEDLEAERLRRRSERRYPWLHEEAGQR